MGLSPALDTGLDAAPTLALRWLPMTTAADIAATLDKARPQSGGGFTACCPAHDDSEPSLSIADGDKGPVVHCHAGCTQDEVLDAIAARGVDLRKPNGNGNGHHVAFNVAELAFVKNLQRSMLESCGVTDTHMDDGASIVGFEYRNAADEVTGVEILRVLGKLLVAALTRPIGALANAQGKPFVLRPDFRLHGEATSCERPFEITTDPKYRGGASLSEFRASSRSPKPSPRELASICKSPEAELLRDPPASIARQPSESPILTLCPCPLF